MDSVDASKSRSELLAALRCELGRQADPTCRSLQVSADLRIALAISDVELVSKRIENSRRPWYGISFAVMPGPWQRSAY